MRLHLGEGGSGRSRTCPQPPLLIWVKKEEMTEGRKAGRVSKTKLGPPQEGRAGRSKYPTSHYFLAYISHILLIPISEKINDFPNRYPIFSCLSKYSTSR